MQTTTTTTQTFPVLRETDNVQDRNGRFYYGLLITVSVPAEELDGGDYTALSAEDRARAVVALAAIGVAVIWSAEYGFELVYADEVEAAAMVQVAA